MNANTITTAAIRAAIEPRKASARSAWGRGVAAYALDLIDNLDEYGTREIDASDLSSLERIALNGAQDWKQYSDGGCSLIYDGDIAARLCTSSELRRFNAGKLDNPNARETWLDYQARALFQAFNLIKETARGLAA